MSAAAKREMLIRCSTDVENVGILENAIVPISGTNHQVDSVPLFQLLSPHLMIDGDYATYRSNWALKAQAFLNRSG